MSVICYLAAEGFEKELAEELGPRLTARHERLCVAHGDGPEPTWAQDTWFDAHTIKIESITHAAREIKSLEPRSAPYAFHLHRRTELISEKLFKIKEKPLRFLDALPSRALGAWTLLENDLLLACPRTKSPFPLGKMEFEESREAPSRAYLKLWELFTVYGVRPQKGDRCIDLGACPGGWTWVLASMGCEVLAIDRSPLAPHVAKMPGVEFQKGNVFTLKPESVGKVDWLFSDVICYPEQLLTLVQTWIESGLSRNYVCTMKFKGATDHIATQKLIRMIPGSKTKHLVHNKHELTWWFQEESSDHRA